MPEVTACESCGMPMETLDMHGGGIEENPYCIYCTDAHGHLKPRADVREGMIQFYMTPWASRGRKPSAWWMSRWRRCRRGGRDSGTP